MLSISEGVKKRLIAMVLIILSVITVKTLFSSGEKQTLKPKAGKVLNRVGDSAWVRVSGLVMPDIVVMTFDDGGQVGAAISLEGKLIKTLNGGESWIDADYVPVEPGEIINALGIDSKGLVKVGTSVDESSYTAIYQQSSDGKWQRLACKDCGGILASSNNGELMVGGGGLVSNFDNQLNKWQFNYLPDWGDVSLYAVSKKGKKILLTGENALLAMSEDEGKSWMHLNSPISTNLPFYSIASSETGNSLLLGGVNGSLFFCSDSNLTSNSSNWLEIKGLDRDLMVSSLLVSPTVLLAGGSKLSGANGFIVSSLDGQTWQYDFLLKDTSRIVSLVITNTQILAASSNGTIFRRTKNNF